MDAEGEKTRINYGTMIPYSTSKLQGIKYTVLSTALATAFENVSNKSLYLMRA